MKIARRRQRVWISRENKEDNDEEEERRYEEKELSDGKCSRGTEEREIRSDVNECFKFPKPHSTRFYGD